MNSFEQLQRGWQQASENRIRSAQAEGLFEDLPGLGRPLEELMDIEDPNGWVRRTVRESVRGYSSASRSVSSNERTQASTRCSSSGNGIEPASSTRS